jgi:histidyl-tRNA synthetase
VCGVPHEKIRSISSAVDKLDKVCIRETCHILVSYSPQLPWPNVRKEMIDEKGLDPTTADKIGSYVKHKGIVKICMWAPLLVLFITQAVRVSLTY